MVEQLAHPTAEQLNSFSMGILPPDEASVIEGHISQCDPCCDTLLQLSNEDTFIDELRDAKRLLSESAATQHFDGTEGPGDGAHCIPEELNDHPRYQVECIVGRGGMGEVYKAEHRIMQRPVALKVINRRLINKPEAVDRFQREVRAAARLHHPNIVAAYDAEQVADSHFLAMEFVEGTELSEIVKRDGPLPINTACDYVRQVAQGLAHAHSMGMVHRDIKPQNLMVTPTGKVKILDFGLANFACEAITDASQHGDSEQDQPVLEQLTQIGAMIGTPDYIAPEQAEDARQADIRSDIYSLGCTLYYLLAGRPPFDGDSVRDKINAHAQCQVASLRSIREEIPQQLQEIVERMMSKHPEARFQSPAAVAIALEELRDEPMPQAYLAEQSKPRRKTGLRWLAAAAMAMATLVIVTDRGRLQIQSKADDVQVVVKKEGQEVRVLDLTTGSQVFWLPTGKYELELVGEDNRVILDKSGFEMTRLGQIIVKAELQESPEQAAESAAEQGRGFGRTSAQNENRVPLASEFALALSIEEFERRNDAMAEKGYRPIDVNTSLSEGAVQVSAIWVPFTAQKHDIKVFVNQSQQESQANFNRLVKKGYRKTRRAGHVANGEARTVSIFEKIDGPLWESRGFMSQERFQRFFDKNAKDGFRLIDFSVLSIGGELRAASIWEEDRSVKWQARLGLPAAAFNKLAKELAQQGYQPLRICPYLEGNRALYASLWAALDNTSREVAVGISEVAFARRNDVLTEQGNRLIQVTTVLRGNEKLFTAIWERQSASKADAAAAKANRVAILTRDGKYWRAPGDGNRLLADRDEVGSDSMFQLEWKDSKDKRVWIKTRHGTYVRGIPDRQGKIETIDEKGSSELFHVEWVDRDTQKVRLRTRDGEYLRATDARGPQLDTTDEAKTSEEFILEPIP